MPGAVQTVQLLNNLFQAVVVAVVLLSPISSSSELHQDTMKVIPHISCVSISDHNFIFLQAFVSSLLVATALAAPADVGYVPAPAYAPAPAPYHPAPAYAPAPYHPEKVPPKPFAYEYGGADEYGRHFAKTETQDELGVVKGES